MGDRVLVSFALGYPVIMGFLPKIQVETAATPLSIGSGQSSLDVGAYGVDSRASSSDAFKPRDMVPGDRVISSSGGGMVAVLKGGSVMIRASKASQIFLNKFQGLVKVFSRNWEHFSDAHSDVIRNFKGRIYRYTGYAKAYEKARVENYALNVYQGDVAAAEAVKTGYHSVTVAPAATPIISKTQILDDAQVELMRDTLDVSGNKEVWIKNGTEFTRVYSTGQELNISWKNQAVIKVNSAGVEASFGSGKISITSSSTKTEFGSHSVTVSASGVSVV